MFFKTDHPLFINEYNWISNNYNYTVNSLAMFIINGLETSYDIIKEGIIYKSGSYLSYSGKLYAKFSNSAKTIFSCYFPYIDASKNDTPIYQMNVSQVKYYVMALA